MKEAFFGISQKDLKASKLLFENGLYPQAIFYLQQSVEKATKFLGLSMGMITFEEAKNDVRHDSFEIYIKMREGLRNLIEITNKSPLLAGITKIVDDIAFEVSGKKIDELLKSLDPLPDIDKDRIRNSPSKKDVTFTIEILNRIESTLDKSSLPSILSNQKLNEAKKKSKEILDAIHTQDPETMKEAERRLNELTAPESRDYILEIGGSWMDLPHVYLSLFLLSYLFPPYHAIYTRYPGENGQDPEDIYNKEHPLIQSYGDLVTIMDKTLSKCGILKMWDSFFKESEDGK